MVSHEPAGGDPAPITSAAEPSPDETPRHRQGFSLAAFLLGGVALVFFPMVVGPVAVLLAAIALSKGEPRGRAAMIVAVTGMVVGMILGAVLWFVTQG